MKGLTYVEIGLRQSEWRRLGKKFARLGYISNRRVIDNYAIAYVIGDFLSDMFGGRLNYNYIKPVIPYQSLEGCVTFILRDFVNCTDKVSRRIQ